MNAIPMIARCLERQWMGIPEPMRAALAEGRYSPDAHPESMPNVQENLWMAVDDHHCLALISVKGEYYHAVP